MKPLLLIFLLQLAYICSFTQLIDKKTIDNKVKLLDKSQSRIYIINGVPFNGQESIKIDSALKSFDPKYLVDVNFVTCKQLNLSHCNSNLVIVSFAYKQLNKTKRCLLKKLRNSFTDNYISFSQHIHSKAKDPVLFIDNQQIHHTETKQKIKLLNLKNIYFIYFSNKPVSELHYGQNAKNGLVRIWTVSH